MTHGSAKGPCLAQHSRPALAWLQEGESDNNSHLSLSSHRALVTKLLDRAKVRHPSCSESGRVGQVSPNSKFSSSSHCSNSRLVISKWMSNMLLDKHNTRTTRVLSPQAFFQIMLRCKHQLVFLSQVPLSISKHNKRPCLATLETKVLAWHHRQMSRIHSADFLKLNVCVSLNE